MRGPPPQRTEWAISSAGEHTLHTGGVVGSIPTSPTIPLPLPAPSTSFLEGPLADDVPTGTAKSNRSVSPEGLADRLKAATHRLHRDAERSGFIRDLLNHRGTHAGYVLFLRNLLPAYEAMEAALDQQAARHGPLAALARPELYRSAAIRSDLDVLHGPGWAEAIAVLEAGAAYANRVQASAAGGSGAGLAGHAYVRYLGDLNGGQILARLLSRDLALPAAGLRFYAFPAAVAGAVSAESYRRAIDSLAALPGLDLDAIEAEAIASFRSAIALADAVSARI
jgi:heme oxygenase (biliverdin-producing, ferredoxin)